MNTDALLAALEHDIRTYSPSRSLWKDICEQYASGLGALEQSRVEQEVLPQVLALLDEEWLPRARMLELENTPKTHPWELGKTLSYDWDYHQMHGDALSEVVELCRSGRLAHYETLVLGELGEKKLEELFDTLDVGCPNASTIRVSLSDALDDWKANMPTVFELLEKFVLGRADKLHTLEIVVPERTRKRSRMMSIFWAMVTSLMRGLPKLHRLEMHFGPFNTNVRDRGMLSAFFGEIANSTIKELGLINLESLSRSFLLGELREHRDKFESLDVLLINSLGSLYKDFWHMTRWLKEARLFHSRPRDPWWWFPWEDEGWKLESNITEAQLAEDGSSITLIEPHIDEIEITCDRHGLWLDELGILLGDETTPMRHEQITEVLVWEPTAESLAFFLKHAPAAFPNLESLKLKCRGGIFPPEEDLPEKCWPKLELLAIECGWGKELLERTSFPELHTLHLGHFDMADIDTLCARHGSLPKLEKLELYDYNINDDGVRTDLIFVRLREAGVLGRLKHFYMDIKEVGDNREAACTIADLVFGDELPLGWRRELFEAIREPATKKVLYTLLRHTGAAVNSKMSREELDRIWPEHVPDELWSFDWSEISHINDLTQYDCF